MNISNLREREESEREKRVTGRDTEREREGEKGMVCVTRVVFC